MHSIVDDGYLVYDVLTASLVPKVLLQLYYFVNDRTLLSVLCL